MQPRDGETLDVLSRTLRLLQRSRGHRATSDDVLLAGHAAEAAPGARRIADLGTGKGTVALLLARAVPDSIIVGVEAYPASQELAVRNAELNSLSHRFTPLLGDLRDPAVLAGQAPFDLICGAPPFMPLGSGTLPADGQRAAGRFELRGGVADYARTAAAHLAAD
ncbi:MAG: methyltransferase, partial [bacterium]